MTIESQPELTNKTIDLDLLELTLFELKSLDYSLMKNKSKFEISFTKAIKGLQITDEELTSIFVISGLLTDEELASIFVIGGLSILEQWKRGESAPHISAYASIFQTLQKFGIEKWHFLQYFLLKEIWINMSNSEKNKLKILN